MQRAARLQSRQQEIFIRAAETCFARSQRSLVTESIYLTGIIVKAVDPENRVYCTRDTVFVESKWIKYNRVLWRNNYASPYTALDTNLFKNTSRNTWLCFAIGVVYGAPDILPCKDVDSSVLNLSTNHGLDDLKNLGVHTDKEHHIYLSNSIENERGHSVVPVRNDALPQLIKKILTRLNSNGDNFCLFEELIMWPSDMRTCSNEINKPSKIKPSQIQSNFIALKI